MSSAPAILVSACLLGIRCRYNGAASVNETVAHLGKKFKLIPVCPEVLGGLATPRDPSEIRGGKVVTSKGTDVTAEYRKGAEAALKIALENHCEIAVLQDRSPSCGARVIHNGKFNGGLVAGNGVTAELLIKNGIKVYNASEAAKLRGE